MTILYHYIFKNDSQIYQNVVKVKYLLMSCLTELFQRLLEIEPEQHLRNFRKRYSLYSVKVSTSHVHVLTLS